MTQNRAFEAVKPSRASARRRPLQRRTAPVTLPAADPRRLLERIVETPELARAVPRLPPDILHRLIRHCGLEDSGELIALSTPEQLTHVFDLDLWRPLAAGGDESFDARRFGEWLEVMVAGGAARGAAILAALDTDLVTMALARHVRVFDRAVLEPYVSLDGALTPTGYGSDVGDGARCDVGGYVVVARRDDAWGAITEMLTALADGHADAFGRVMRGCARLSDSGREVDGLDSLLETGDQTSFDLAVDREDRRHARGYVSPAEARAFLHAARRTSLTAGSAPPQLPALQAFTAGEERVEPAAFAVGAGLQTRPADVPATADPLTSADSATAALVAVVDLLRGAGIVAREETGLLPSAREPHASTRLDWLRTAAGHDPAAFAACSAALAFLANALIAGTSVQGRPLEADEASAAALAVCNLGLECWPAHWPPGDAVVQPDLIAAFHVGWTLLHEDVCMFTADRLLTVLATLQCHDPETDAALGRLRIVLTRELRTGTPWNARDALDAVALLDPVSWVALTGVIDQFPVLPAAVAASVTASPRPVSPTAFEFIASSEQVRLVHAFADVLGQRLG